VVRRDRTMVDHAHLNPVRLNLKAAQKIGERNGLAQVKVDSGRMSFACPRSQRPKQEDFNKVSHREYPDWR